MQYTMNIYNLLRKFIDDKSENKVLIGSRCVGKTTALAFNAIMNATENKNTKSIVVSNYPSYLIDRIVDICKYLNKGAQVICNKSSYTITINKSVIIIMNWQKYYSNRERANYIYIDEPNLSPVNMSMRDIINIATRITMYEEKKQIVIVGSNSKSSKFNDIVKIEDFEFSRFTASNLDFENKQLKSYFDSIKARGAEAIRSEIFCEFI